MSAPFLILVTGGREYTDHDAVFRALDSLHAKHENITVIHGACPTGADAFAHQWAITNERPVIAVPAMWASEGAAAGPKRNGRMLCYLPNGVAAFPGGIGTADMCRQAEAAGVKVWSPVR